MPKISVIVPVYKAEKYLNRCVDSILNQTFTDFELILVDDGSPDNCGNICEEYAQKDNRTIVLHKENGGVSSARNYGIDWVFAHSDSEWIIFVDSDDLINSRCLEVLFNEAVSNNADISVGKIRKFKGEVKIPEIVEYKVNLCMPEEYFTTNYYAVAYCVAKLFKISIFKNIRFPIGIRFEDEHTTYRIVFNANKIAVIDKDIYYYFQNNQGFMIEGSKTDNYKGELFNAWYQQILFFAENNYVNAFDMALYVYFFRLKNFCEEYKRNKKDIEVCNVQKRKTKRLLKQYYKIIDFYKYLEFYKFFQPVKTFFIRAFKKIFRICHINKNITN